MSRLPRFWRLDAVSHPSWRLGAVCYLRTGTGDDPPARRSARQRHRRLWGSLRLPPRDPKVQRLASLAVFDGLGRRRLRSVARLADEVVIAPGSRLTSAGRPALQGFLVLSGRLVARDRDGTLWLLGPGAAPGLAALAARTHHTSEVTALTRTRLIVLTPQNLPGVLAAAPALRAMPSGS